MQANLDEMSQQFHEVDITAAVESLWKLQTSPVDVSVLTLHDGSSNCRVLAEKDQFVTRCTRVDDDLKIIWQNNEFG